ncbi:MAG: hypothetical protein SNJ81_19455 [Cyanobacteriota bacterium]
MTQSPQVPQGLAVELAIGLFELATTVVQEGVVQEGLKNRRSPPQEQPALSRR